MPVIPQSTYKAPPLLAGPHVQTVFASRFRRVGGVRYERERMELPDGDFMDLDWVRNGAGRLAVLTHGLEGSAQRSYMKGMARAFCRRGWDSVSVNLRSCSGEPNRLLRSYHHGVSEDLHAVVDHVCTAYSYDTLALIGFSLGANLTMKYLGEGVYPAPTQVKAAVAFSVPCDLEACARRMEGKEHAFYMKYFLGMLREKHRAKSTMFPGQLDVEGFEHIRTFKQHDDRYTAPIHGFTDAEDYWRSCACGRHLDNVRIPSLIVNAADDPFLAPSCYPYEQAEKNSHVYLEVPDHGGHVGFVTLGNRGEYWSESRATSFVDEHCASPISGS